MVVFVLERMQLYFLVRIRGLRQLLDGKGLLWSRLHPDLVGRAILGKSLIKFSVDGCSCTDSVSWLACGCLVLEYADSIVRWKVTSKRSYAIMDLSLLLLPMLLTLQQATSVTHASAEDHQALIDKCDSVFCGSPSFPLCPGLHKVLFVPS